MNIAIAGSSGFIGAALVAFLEAGGHTVVRLVRRSPAPGSNEIFWNPAQGVLDDASLEGLDGVVNLAGENLAQGRWTRRKKSRIVTSRLDSTRLLARVLSAMKSPPKVWISASAIGAYGHRGDDPLTEKSARGSGFLAGLCQEWEQAALSTGDGGIRVVTIRTGVVMGPGGALKKMLLPFKWGLGGPIGSGHQYMSWIDLDDAVRAILHLITTPALQGPVNLVSPNPVTNRDFTRTLGRVLRRPTFIPLPAVMARLVFGEMADEMLLASTRVLPTALVDSGFEFRYPSLEDALRHALGKT